VKLLNARPAQTCLVPYSDGEVATSSKKWWVEMDSNQRKLTLADLQSAPFSRSGIYPYKLVAGVGIEPTYVAYETTE
jgi:hypothetical protein